MSELVNLFTRIDLELWNAFVGACYQRDTEVHNALVTLIEGYVNAPTKQDILGAIGTGRHSDADVDALAKMIRDDDHASTSATKTE